MADQTANDKAIAWAKEQRDWAASRLEDFKKGERLFRGTGQGPTVEVTDKHKAHYEKQVVRMDDLIAAYKKLE